MWQEGEVEWTPARTVVYPALCSIAGLVAGMFGVGGGIVKMRSYVCFPCFHAAGCTSRSNAL